MRDQRADRSRYQIVGIVEPGQTVSRALLAGKFGRRHRRIDHDLVLVARQRLDRQSDRRVRHVGHHVDAIDVEPFPDNTDADIRLVLMVCGQNFDLDRRDQFLKILCRHFGGSDGARSRQIGQWSGLVIDNADPDDAAGEFGRASGQIRPDENPNDQKSSDAAVPDHASTFPMMVLSGFPPLTNELKQPPLLI